MKIIYFFILSFFFAAHLPAQVNTYHFDLFNAEIENNVLKVWNKDKTLIYEKTFSDAAADTADLDNDGVNELLIYDTFKKRDGNLNKLFIYNTIDSFFIADSINSGLVRPYLTYSEEIKGNMIVTGNPGFDSFNTDTDYIYLPLNCWNFESGKVSGVNGKIYDFFIAENDTLIETIDSYLESNPKDCNTSNYLKAIIASVYVNYLQAGEKTLAKQFLLKYYFCKDLEKFKQKIASLL